MTSPPSLTRTLRLSRPPEEVAAWIEGSRHAAQLPGIEISSTEGPLQVVVPDAPGGRLHLTAAPEGDRIAWQVVQGAVDGTARMRMRLDPDGGGSRICLEAGPVDDEPFAAASAELAGATLTQLLLNLEGLAASAGDAADTRHAAPRPAEEHPVHRQPHVPVPDATDEAAAGLEVDPRFVVAAAVAAVLGLVLWLRRRGRNAR